MESNCKSGWIDVTDTCRRLASSLDDANPVMHVDGFSMFDAMSAIELMDEKMDSCYGVTGPIQVDDILNEAMPSMISPEDALLCMQRLVLCEMSYANGASMIETFKNCIFMWPQLWPRLEECGDMGKILLAFIKSLASSTGIFHKFVLGSDIYEEEDFHPASSAVPVDPEDAATALQQGIDILTALIGSVDTAEVYSQMLALMELRASIIKFYESIDQIIVKALDISQKKEVGADNKTDKLAGIKKTEIEASCRSVFSATKVLVAKVRSLSSCHDISNVSLNLMSPTLVEDTKGTFQPKISKLVSNNPTRTILALTLFECISMLETICRESAAIVKTIPGFCSENTSYDNVLAWCNSISKSKYHLVSRSLQWGLLHTLCSLGGMERLLVASLKESWLPDAYTTRRLCIEWIETFAKVAWDTLKLMCMFRYKCLVKLDSNVMSWNKISVDAPRVDQAIALELYPAGVEIPTEIYWSTKWALRILSVLLENHLVLLSELDLVSGFELDSYYWFMDYVTSTHIWAIRKLREMRFNYDKLMHTYTVAEATKTVKVEKKNKKSTLSGKQLKELKRIMESPPPVIVSPPLQEMLALASNTLYKGVIRLIVLLLRIGYIRAAPESEFTTKEIRFNSRYSLYRSLSHIAPVSLADFERAVFQVNEVEPSTAAKLSSTSAALGNAKKAFDFIRKTQLADIVALSTELDSSSEYSVFEYTVRHEVNEKCTGLMKVSIRVYNHYNNLVPLILN